MTAERDPIELATRALRHRDRSRRELDERLARAGVPRAARDEALDRLEQVGYVDDGRFAAARAAALAGRGYGDGLIRLDLSGHGIDAEAVEAALALLEPEPARAAGLLAREGAGPRLARRLERKGFAPETVAAALGPGFAEGGDGA